MPSIRLTRFSGVRPATNPRLLDPKMATQAHNVVLRSGTILAMQGGVAVAVQNTPGVVGPIATLTQLHTTTDAQGVVMTLDYQAAVLEAPYPGSADYGAFVVFPYGDASRRPQRWLPRDLRFAPLEVAAPTAAPVATLVADAILPNTYTGPDERAYVYTWVDEFGAESRPSPPSAPGLSNDGATWSLQGFSAPPPNATGMNIYRASSAFEDGRRPGTSFDSSFQLVVPEISVPLQAGVLFDNRTLNDMEGGTLLTHEDGPVPNIMDQVVLTEHGYYVGWHGTTVYVSERYEAHNWPRRYQLDLADTVVGAVASGTHVFIGTTGRPYRMVITPTERTIGQATAMPMADANVDAQQYPFDWPCLAMRAMVSTDFGAVYPTQQGLAALRAQGGLLLETRERIDETQWVEWMPNTATWYRGRYYGHNAPAGKAFVLDLTADGDSIEMGDLVTADLDFTLAHNGRDGFLYFAKGNSVVRWGYGVPLRYVWRSKRFVMPGELAFAGAKVVGDFGPAVTFRLYKGDMLVVTRSVATSKPFRLPFHGRGTDWLVEIEGTTPVTEIHVASSFNELTAQEVLA